MQDSIEDYIRISRNTKEETAVIRKETLINAQIQKECDAKALQIVQFAIEGKMRPDALFKCLPFINQEHYQDIVEERAITKLCGYPLCSKRIPEMPKKQFFISTKSNKVYDITDRKNYCTNYCYRASIHIKTQIDTNPLWLRNHQDKTQFTILNKSERGLPGQIVVDHIFKKPTSEPFFASVSDFAHISLDEAEEFELNPQEESSKTVKKPKKFQKNPMKTIAENEEEDQIDEPLKPEPKTTQNEPKIDLESHLKKCFRDWFTLETYIFVHGEENVRKTLNSDTLNQYFDSLNVADLQQEQQKRYIDICRKLRLKDLADEKFDFVVLGRNLKPIPDYKNLKLENRETDLKVKAFYGGELQIKQNKTESIKKEEIEGSPAVFPLLDVNSQSAVRRKIFLSSLNKSLLNLLQSLRVDSSLVQQDLQSLVKTFKLQANNIVFKPTVWNCIAVILLKILSLKNKELESHLETEKSKHQLSVFLSMLPPKTELINDVLSILTTCDTFVTNYITCT